MDGPASRLGGPGSKRIVDGPTRPPRSSVRIQPRCRRRGAKGAPGCRVRGRGGGRRRERRRAGRAPAHIELPVAFAARIQPDSPALDGGALIVFKDWDWEHIRHLLETRGLRILIILVVSFVGYRLIKGIIHRFQKSVEDNDP